MQNHWFSIGFTHINDFDAFFVNNEFLMPQEAHAHFVKIAKTEKTNIGVPFGLEQHFVKISSGVWTTATFRM